MPLERLDFLSVRRYTKGRKETPAGKSKNATIRRRSVRGTFQPLDRDDFLVDPRFLDPAAWWPDSAQSPVPPLEMSRKTPPDMIQKPTDSLVVEGPLIRDREGDADSFPRRRVEIARDSGTIIAVGEPKGSGDLVLSNDHLVFPGMIDVHVHAREDPSGRDNYKETFASAGAAAVNGGVTAFAEMPNNPEAPVDDASYARKRALTEASPADVLLYAGVGPTTSPLSFPAPYKVYFGPSIGELFFSSESETRQAVSRYRGHRISFHAEDPELLAAAAGASTHPERRPPEAEIRAIECIVELAEAFGFEPNICHLSTAGGLEVIRAARRRGNRITCEVAPHHLYWDQENQSSFHRPSFLQCNPPLRTRADRSALLDALKNDEIDYFATDHAPHALEENEAGISGMPQLDTFGAFLFWLVDEGVSWQTIRKACCERPGQFLNHYGSTLYGRVEPGFVGSLTILERRAATVRRENLRTQAGWSPFEGITFSGRVAATVVRGEVYRAASAD